MTSLGSWPINRLHVEFTRRHISWTQPRNEIYLAIQQLGPCRPADLISVLNDRMSSRTVLRTVKLLLEIGVIIHVDHELIELAPPHQQHRHYLNRHFTPTTHQIEVAGRCEMCV